MRGADPLRASTYIHCSTLPRAFFASSSEIALNTAHSALTARRIADVPCGSQVEASRFRDAPPTEFSTVQPVLYRLAASVAHMQRTVGLVLPVISPQVRAACHQHPAPVRPALE